MCDCAPVQPATSSSRREALHCLLLDLFNEGELRRWIRNGVSPELAAGLPGESVSPSDLVDGTIGILERRGLIDGSFFSKLREERSGRGAEIDAVAALWATNPADLERPATQPRARRRLLFSRRERPGPADAARHDLSIRGQRRGDAIRWSYHVLGALRPEISLVVSGATATIERARRWLRAPDAASTLAIGESLGRLLFGDTSDRGLQRALRCLFGRPAEAADLVLRPAFAPVRARLILEDSELRGLPWTLTALDANYLADDGWTFEIADPQESEAHVRLPGPCTLLVIAPRAGAPEGEVEAHLRDLDELLARIWPLPAARGRLAEHRRIARTEPEIREVLRARRPEVVYFLGRAQLVGDEPPRIILDGEFGGGASVELDALLGDLHGAKVVFLNLHGRNLHELAAAPLPGPACVLQPLATADPADAMDVGLAWIEALLRRGHTPVAALDAALCEGAGERAALMVARTRYTTWRTEIAPTEDYARKVPVRLDRTAQRTLLLERLLDFTGGPQRLLSVVAPAPEDQRPERLGGVLLQHVHDRIRGRDLHLVHAALPFPRASSAGALRDRLARAFEEGLVERRDDETLEHAIRRHVEDDARRRGLGHGTRSILWIDWQRIGPDPPVTTELLDAWLRFGVDVAAECPASIKILSLLTVVASPAGCAALGGYLDDELLTTPLGRSLISLTAAYLALPAAGDVNLRDLTDFLTHHASCPNDLVVPVAASILSETRGNYQATVERLESIERSGAWSSLAAATSSHPSKKPTTPRTFA